MSGRLPGLNQGKPATGSSLKFKPKVVARRSKEERDATAPKVEEVKQAVERKKYGQRPQNNQKRQPKYLNNTRVITSGPLAAGNFSGGPSKINGFIKAEGSQSSLLQQGLKAVGSDEEGDMSDSEDAKYGKRINMGKEFTEEDFKKETEDIFEEDDNDVDMDEEFRRSKQLADLFPVRAVRIHHDKVDSMKKAVQESMTDPNTRDPTPGPVKLEPESSSDVLSGVVRQKQQALKDNLQHLKLQNEFQSVDAEEALRETNLLFQDYKHIYKKLNKINDVPNKFIFFQFPSNLPEFQRPTKKIPLELKPEDITEEQLKDKAKNTEKAEKSNTNIKSKSQTKEPEQPTIGKIGAIRVHQSGRMSVKIGNVVMDISRGAESTFLQDVISLDLEGEEAELLGQIDGRAVVTPHIKF